MNPTRSIADPRLAFNSHHAEQARRVLYAKVKGDPHWVNALEAAWKHLQLTGWAWNGTHLIARSADGQRRYVATRSGCECRAALHNNMCWHMAAWHTLSLAGKLAAATNN